MNPIPPEIPEQNLLSSLNETELAQLIRRQTGLIVARGMGRDRMIELLENGGMPKPEGTSWDSHGVMYFHPEISKTQDSRKRLQLFIEKNWNSLQSQLPCKGENRGRCTIYPCPEGRHIDCLLAASSHMKMHGL